MLVEAIDGSEEAIHPDFDRIAAYHRRPLAARYAQLLRKLTANVAQKPMESARR
jgi:hypothetical protein